MTESVSHKKAFREMTTQVISWLTGGVTNTQLSAQAEVRGQHSHSSAVVKKKGYRCWRGEAPHIPPISEEIIF